MTLKVLMETKLRKSEDDCKYIAKENSMHSKKILTKKITTHHKNDIENNVHGIFSVHIF